MNIKLLFHPLDSSNLPQPSYVKIICEMRKYLKARNWYRKRALARKRKRKMVRKRAKQAKHSKGRTGKSVITLDEGVFIEILSRLSVKSIYSFKPVCKNWHSLISDKYFAKKQFEQSRENPTFISCPLMDPKMRLYSMRPGSFELSPLITIDPAERSQDDSMYMISSFNGLICCINEISDENVESEFHDLQIWICNPCTGETLLLPQGRPSLEVEPSVGVAYASNNSDYKVFRIFCSGKKIREERVPWYSYQEYDFIYECEVYSSSTCSWRNIGSVPRIPMRSFFSPFRSTHVVVGGKVFWLVSLDEGGEILSVDMEGRFEVIRLPPYPEYLREEDQITVATYPMTLQGSLSLVILHVGYMDVWVWKDEGEGFRWVLVCEDYTPFEYEYGEELVLGMTSIKNQILCMTETEWWTYDVDTRIWSKEEAPLSGFCNPCIFPFTESLLPCNGSMML